MGRRKIEIKRIKDDRNRSVYVMRSLGQWIALTIKQDVPEAQRRPVQESARAIRALQCRRRSDNIRSEQEAVRILVF